MLNPKVDSWSFWLVGALMVFALLWLFVPVIQQVMSFMPYPRIMATVLLVFGVLLWNKTEVIEKKSMRWWLGGVLVLFALPYLWAAVQGPTLGSVLVAVLVSVPFLLAVFGKFEMFHS